MKETAACDGTDCPAGCCMGEYNWFCCKDGQHCAANEEICPSANLINLARLKAKSKKVRIFSLDLFSMFFVLGFEKLGKEENLLKIVECYFDFLISNFSGVVSNNL